MFRLLLTASLGLLLAASSGCVVRPLHQQQIFNHRTLFQGFAPQPNLPIHVQVYAGQDANGQLRWDTLKTVNSGRYPYQNRFVDDGSFYFWNAGSVRIPERYWGPWVPGFKLAITRVVTEDGTPLPTYRETPDLFADPIQEFRDHGANGHGLMYLFQRE